MISTHQTIDCLRQSAQRRVNSNAYTAEQKYQYLDGLRYAAYCHGFGEDAEEWNSLHAELSELIKPLTINLAA